MKMHTATYSINVDLHNRLVEEVAQGKWASESDGLRYYLRKGMEQK